MSEATPLIADTEDALLSELAALDLALVKHVHAKAMAAEDTDEINSLSRTYQRLARSLRQTLALKAQLQRQRPAAPAQTDEATPLSPEVRQRRRAIRAGVLRVIWNEQERCPDPFEREEELDDILEDMAGNEDFLETSVEDYVGYLCDAMELPAGPSGDWASLPEIPKYGDRRLLFNDTS